MAHVTKPFSFANGDLIDAVKFESIHDIIYNEFNGNIDNSNIKSLAAIEGTKIASAPNGIGTSQLNDDSVTSAKLKDSASVDGDRAVTTDHIRDGAITSDKLATDSVTQVKIADGILALDKLKNLVQETVAFTISGLTSGSTFVAATLWVEVSGSNYIAKVSGYVQSFSAGVLFWSTGSTTVTPTTAIPTASKKLISVYLTNLVWSDAANTITGNVVFLSADNDS